MFCNDVTVDDRWVLCTQKESFLLASLSNYILSDALLLAALVLLSQRQKRNSIPWRCPAAREWDQELANPIFIKSNAEINYSKNTIYQYYVSDFFAAERIDGDTKMWLYFHGFGSNNFPLWNITRCINQWQSWGYSLMG